MSSIFLIEDPARMTMMRPNANGWMGTRVEESSAFFKRGSQSCSTDVCVFGKWVSWTHWSPVAASFRYGDRAMIVKIFRVYQSRTGVALRGSVHNGPRFCFWFCFMAQAGRRNHSQMTEVEVGRAMRTTG